MLPEIIFIDGEESKFEVIGGYRIPDHPDHYRLIALDRKQKVLFSAWYDTRFSLIKPTHLDVYNKEHAYMSPKKLTFIYESGESGNDLEPQPILLSRASGYSWVNEEYLATLTTTGSTMHDGWFDNQMDPKSTKDTGSANMEFFAAEECIIDEYGLSMAAIKWLDRYRRQQVMRPRWYLDHQGTPYNILSPDTDPYHNEWWFNAEGYNAYDSQHMDGKELELAYKYTGHPIYLYALINLWVHAEAHSTYLKIPPTGESQGYSGAARTPGWWLALCSQLFSCLSALSSNYDFLRDRIIASVTFHVDNVRAIFPLCGPWYYGSCPEIIKNAQKDYTFGWQQAILAWGLKKVSEVFIEDMYPNINSNAEGGTEEILGLLEDHSDPSSTQFGYAWACDDDPELLVMGSPPGTMLWYAPPFAHKEMNPIYISIKTWLGFNGWLNPSHKYFPYALEVLGKDAWNW